MWTMIIVLMAQHLPCMAHKTQKARNNLEQKKKKYIYIYIYIYYGQNHRVILVYSPSCDMRIEIKVYKNVGLVIRNRLGLSHAG